MTRAAFSPTVLLVDDDQVITRRWTKEFYRATSLGVVVANSIVEGRKIMESDDVNVDAVVADLFFDYGKDDPENGLYDGLDFLRAINDSGKELPMFVISATADMLDYKRRADQQKIPVIEFFDKFYTAEQHDPAWVKIQRSVIANKFGAESEIAQALDVGSNQEHGLDLVNQALCRLQMPIRTYVQFFPPKAGVTCIKPIEVLCVAQAPDQVRAYAPCLGLLSVGKGEDVESAISELKLAIEADAISLLNESRSAMSPYPTKVADKLRQYVALWTPQHAH